MDIETYEPDFLDEAAEERAKTDPAIRQDWAAIKLVSELRGIRDRKGLTQVQVAERMGVPQAYVARIERRPWSIGFSRILSYAQALDVDLAVREPQEIAQAA